MTGRAQATAAALVASGVLWAVHGPLTMLQPWGEEARYSDERGYSLVVDDRLFLLYNGPGAAALLLTAVAVLTVARRLEPVRPRLAGAGRAALWLGAALGVVTVAGVVALVDPVFTAARVAGALLVGLGALLVAAAARPEEASRTALGITGALVLGLLPLWPLVYAVRALPAWGGAAYFVVLGLAVAGLAVRSEPALASDDRATAGSVIRSA